MRRLLAPLVALVLLAGCDTTDPLVQDPDLLIGSWDFVRAVDCGDGSMVCIETDMRDEQVAFRPDSTFEQTQGGRVVLQGAYETTGSGIYAETPTGRTWLGVYQVSRSELVLSTAPADGPTTTYRRLD